MEQAFRDLIEFRTQCGHPPTTGPPEIPDERTCDLRMELIDEEYDELTEALDDRDLTGIADGIADLIYVCIGTAVRLGIDLVPVWNAIHSANLAKFGPVSYRRADGKLMKPPGWTHPDVAAIIASQRSIAETYGNDTNTNTVTTIFNLSQEEIAGLLPTLEYFVKTGEVPGSSRDEKHDR